MLQPLTWKEAIDGFTSLLKPSRQSEHVSWLTLVLVGHPFALA